MKVFIIFIALFGPSLGQLCPPVELISPCYCYLNQSEFGNIIACGDLPRNFDLKAHFDNISSRFQDDHVFDTLTLAFNFFILRIEEGTFEHMQFNRIIFTENYQLSSIHPRAFNASRGTTKSLHISNNAISNAGVLGNVFDFVRSFENLELFDMKWGEPFLTAIPPNAFANMSSLQTIWFYDGNIDTIGSGAFSGCPSLTEVNLAGNHIPSAGLPDEAFGGITSKEAYFDLSSLEINWLEQRSYQPLLDTVGRVRVGYGGNRQFYCDERADWICENEREYKGKLVAFNCEDQSGYEDIWDYCSGKNVTNQFYTLY